MAKLTDKNRLSKTHPHLVKEWDFARNSTLKPEDVSYGSGKKVSWICERCEHNWSDYVYHRSSKKNTRGCPACSGKAVTDKNRLSILYPKVAAEWDFEKNCSLRPEDVSYSSNKKVCWKCKEGHFWSAYISNRTRNKNPSGCPYCSGYFMSNKNRLSITHPDIAEEWDYERNLSLQPEDVSYGVGKEVWWLCSVCGYGWATSVNSRTYGVGVTGCPACAGKVLTDKNRLSTTHQELCKEWDFEKNFMEWKKDSRYPRTPEEISYGNHIKIWWYCVTCGCSWLASVNKRAAGSGCPKCTNGPVSKMSQLWLDGLGIPDIYGITREVALYCGDKRFIVDGFDHETNTVYEFLGDIWHGNPNVCDMEKVNRVNKKPNAFLFDETMGRLFLLRRGGYNLNIIWEEDYCRNKTLQNAVYAL